MSAVFAIDPGQNGAFVRVLPDGTLAPYPFTHTTYKDVAVELSACAGKKTLFLEKVHTMPGQGIASSGKFMRDVGTWYGIALACGCKIVEVTPQTWQKAMKCMSKGDKNVTKRRAQELFPYLHVTHATADALLIAEYGRLMMGGL